MLRINAQRLHDDLDSLAQIGSTGDGGVSRPALSEVDVAGRGWFRQRVADIELEVKQDGAGNLSVVLPGTDPNARTLLTGSHLDSVPNGGRFDGALGTLSAFECLRAIKEAQISLPVHLEVISFTDEEGENVGLFGSRAYTGLLSADELDHPRGGLDKLQAGMARVGITRDGILNAQRNPDELLAFVEIHIEQGTRLEGGNLDIGVITAIVGIRSFWLTFTGRANHAGTTPMDERADALWGVAAFVERGRELVMEKFAPGVMNVGQVSIEPGAFNIVPAQARFMLEFRHGDPVIFDEMQNELLELAVAIGTEFKLDFVAEAAGNVAPAVMSETVIEAVEAAATRLGLSHTRLMSFAGHDTQSLSTITPSTMLFVPSVSGISHNPLEYSKPEDVENGANVLLHTLLNLAGVDA